MIGLKNKKKIKRITEELFKKMTLPITTVRVETKKGDQERIVAEVSVNTEEPKVVIGEKGKTLHDIQRLLGMMVNNQLKEDFYINLDVNDYKEKKEEYLKNLAKETADEVALTKKEKPLPPMNSYERRIIHVELSDRVGVKTESEGKEPKRRVVIKPS